MADDVGTLASTPSGTTFSGVTFTFTHPLLVDPSVANLRETLHHRGRVRAPVVVDAGSEPEFHKPAPRFNSFAWHDRAAKGDALVRSLLLPDDLEKWDKHHALQIRYHRPHSFGDNYPDAHSLILFDSPPDRGRWELGAANEVVYRRNLWAVDVHLWSFEDEVVSFLMLWRSNPSYFVSFGCRGGVGAESIDELREARTFAERLNPPPRDEKGRFQKAS